MVVPMSYLRDASPQVQIEVTQSFWASSNPGQLASEGKPHNCDNHQSPLFLPSSKI